MRKSLPLILLILTLILSCSKFPTGNKTDAGGSDDSGAVENGGYVPPNQPPEDEIYLFVVNSLGETISRIDLSDGSVLNNIYTTGAYPAEIEYYDQDLYVVNSGDNTLQKINLETGDSEFFEIGDYRNPAFVEFIGAEMAVTANWESGTVSFINVLSGAVVDEIPVGIGLWGMTYYSGKIYIGITNYDPVNWTYGQGRVAVINADNRTLEDSIDVSVNPGILFVDFQNELNVVCIGDYFSSFAEIYRIDPVGNTVISSYTLGGSPSYEALSQEGKVFLGSGGWLDEAYVMCYDAQSENIIYGGANPIVLSGETGAQGVAIDDEGNIYVCCFNTNHVVKMTESGQVLDIYEVGDGPQTIVYVEISGTGVWRP